MDTRYTRDDSARSRSLEHFPTFEGFGAVSVADLRQNICNIPAVPQMLNLMQQALKHKSLSYYKSALNTLLAQARKIPFVGTNIIPTTSQVRAIWTAADGFSKLCSSKNLNGFGAVGEEDSFWDPTFLRVFATSIDVVHKISPLLWTASGVTATGGTAGGLIGLAGAGVGSIPGWVVDILAGILAGTTGAANIAVMNKLPTQLRTAASDIEKQRKAASTSSKSRGTSTKGGGRTRTTAVRPVPGAPAQNIQAQNIQATAKTSNKMLYATVGALLLGGAALVFRPKKRK